MPFAAGFKALGATIDAAGSAARHTTEIKAESNCTLTIASLKEYLKENFIEIILEVVGVSMSAFGKNSNRPVVADFSQSARC
jgi:hypothetical protein